jgi:hypothetical protein
LRYLLLNVRIEQQLVDSQGARRLGRVFVDVETVKISSLQTRMADVQKVLLPLPLESSAQQGASSDG